jgi:CRISPR-associated endonuclease Csn1
MRIFGFDIGTTSIGFAAIEIDETRQQGSILRLGARIFPEARDPDGTPLNQQRRSKRMMRRQLRRRKERRKALNSMLSEAGLLPRFSSPEWNKVMSADPYALRARGLDEPLEPYEIGRALYHLAKRRHFKARDLEEEDGAGEEAGKISESTKDEEEAKSNRDATLKALANAHTTLGKWLAAKPAGERKRGVHATRDVVVEEFNAFWDAQAKWRPGLLGAELKERVEDTMFAQKPVFWRTGTLGQCRLQPGAELCPKGSWLSQQRRMLEKLNNLAIAGGNARPLDHEERAAILTKLQTQASMSWSGVRRALEPTFKARGESAKTIKFNLELGGDSKLLGNSLEAKLADIFGPEWIDHPNKNALRNEVHARLWAADYGKVGAQRVVILSDRDRKEGRAKARDSFIRDFAVSPEQADALASIKLPQGWEPYSTAALQKILPELEKGERFGTILNSPERKWAEWRNENFPNREQPTGEVYDKLPSPTKMHPDELSRIKSLRNPTVVRAQNELRKVVNNLISLYGKPDLIRIELARDVGKSKREREEIKSAIRTQERKRRAAEADLKSKGISSPSRADIEKWLLWKESQERCPYSRNQIGFDDLFRRGLYEVEHIWPLPRSLDDSFKNKTLCHRDWNQRKGKRTPFEAFGHTEEWAAIKDGLDKLLTVKDAMSPGKIRRFLAESMPEDFASRQLTDTRYAARQAVAFLKKLWPDMGPETPVKVQSVNGKVTAQLRKRWGLNNILSDDGEKTRADHRHHAVDALAVACANPAYVKRLSDYYKNEERGLKPHLPEPWSTIRQDATAAVDAIIVSHRVRKKVSGPLHDEMPLGYTKKDVVKGGVTLGIYVKRMPVGKLSLETLKIERVEDISRTAKFVVEDKAIRQALRAHLEKTNAPPAKAYPPYPRVNEHGSEIRKARVLTVQQRTLMRPVANGFADPANNHHIVIYRLPDGKTGFEVVSLIDALGRLSRREPVVRRDRGDGSTFVMSLAMGEALEFPPDHKMKGYKIVQGVWASGVVVMRSHTDATNDKDTVSYPTAASIFSARARKVLIDPIGRVHPAND